MSNLELKYQILKIFEKQPDMTQRELAKMMGVSLGKAHYLIKSLADVGWIKLNNFKKSNNKWGYVYLLTPIGVLEKTKITGRFLTKKQNEFEELRKEIALLEKEISQQKLYNLK